jgi:hypothetical protein
MIGPEAVYGAPRLPRRRRRIRIILGILLALALVGAAYTGLILFLVDRDLREALQETDRLDPGWKLEDLETKRADIPHAHNSALVVLQAAGLLPTSWPPWLAGGRGTNQRLLLDPTEQLDTEQVQDLRTALAKASDALQESRKLEAMPNGRYPLETSPDILQLRRPHLQLLQQIATLLSFDILLRAHEEDNDGALASCQALLNVGRSPGDEPGFDSALARMEIRSLVTRKIEHVLAQGQPTEAPLSGLQRLLEQEEAEPLFLIGARGQRVAWERFFELLRSGELTNNRLQQDFARVGAFNSRPAILRLTSRVVEIAKLPVESQRQALQAAFLAKESKQYPWFAWIYLVPKVEVISTNLAKGQARTQAELRCALAALAAERYRQPHGDWPPSLAALVPDYLAQVPTDPFDGQPLRMCRREKGVVIYSVGPDGQDCGGELIRPGKPDAPGFRLWDEPYRRQPPKP